MDFLAQFYQALAPRDGTRALCVARPATKPLKATMCASVEAIARLAHNANTNGNQVWVAQCCFHGDARKGAEATDGRLIAMDVDLKAPSDRPTKPHFKTKEEAAATILRAVAAGLPAPTYVVDSGNGLHLWFEFDEPFPTDGNKKSAYHIANCALHDHYVDFDPRFGADTARRGDMAGLFRLPGVYNRKVADAPLMAWFYSLDGVPLSTGVRLDHSVIPSVLLDKAPVRDTLLSLPPYNTRVTWVNGAIDGGLRTRLNVPSFKLVFDSCAAMRYYRDNMHDMGYDAYRTMIRYSTYADDGNAFIHEISKDHPAYNPSDIDNKFDYELNDTGAPPICSTFGKYVDGTGSVCHGCPAFGASCKFPHLNPGMTPPLPERVQAPTPAPPPPVGADDPAPTPAPIEGLTATPWGQLQEIAPPILLKPDGKFMITSGFYTTAVAKDGDGDTNTIQLFDHAIWAERAITSSVDGEQVLVFRAVRERDGALIHKTVQFPNWMTATDINGTLKAFAKEGVGVKAVTSTDRMTVQRFLYEEHARIRNEYESNQVAHLGWQNLEADERENREISFVVGGTMISSKGVHTKAALTGGLSRNKDRYGMKGTPDKQTEMLRVYNQFGSDIGKFIMCLSAGSPSHALHYTGAPLIVLTGTSAVGKSALCEAATSLWVNPRKSILTPRDTELAAYSRAGALHNLPVVQDEITFKDRTALKDMVHALSQGGNRGSMTQFDGERADSPSWATMAVWTSNKTVVGQLGGIDLANDAVVNRVLELDVAERTLAIDDYDLLASMRADYAANFGHIGKALGHYYATNRAEIMDLHVGYRKQVSAIVAGKGHDTLRYWVQAFQAFMVGAYLLNRMGLIQMDNAAALALTQRLYDQAIERVSTGRQTADDMLRRFVSEHSEQMVQISMWPHREGEPQAYYPSNAHGAKARLVTYENHHELTVPTSAMTDWLQRRDSQLSAFMTASHNEGLTRMSGSQHEMLDLYEGVTRFDRNNAMLKGHVAVPCVVFNVSRRSAEERDAAKHEQQNALGQTPDTLDSIVLNPLRQNVRY